MKKILFILSILFMITSCSTQSSTTNNGNDGSSYEKAIVIKASSEDVGVRKEYEWIRNNYPNSQFDGQSTGSYKGRHYDVITIINSDNQEKTIYFDINNFYGKF